MDAFEVQVEAIQLSDVTGERKIGLSAVCLGLCGDAIPEMENSGEGAVCKLSNEL